MHDTVIKNLRKENVKMRVQYESSIRKNWTDTEFKTVLDDDFCDYTQLRIIRIPLDDFGRIKK